MSSSAAYTLLDGVWPVLGQSLDIPPSTMDDIKRAGSGEGISNNIDWLSLGEFYIDVDLLEAHPCQRELNPAHVNNLQGCLESQGVLRTEHPAVVIGLGEGWNHMRKNKPLSYRIRKSCSFLSKLQAEPSGPIARVIRGGHRTESIKNYSKEEGRADQAYWYYTVLVPGE
jgi:hypothetical protein